LSTLQGFNNTPLPRAFIGGVLRRLQASDLALFQAYRSIPELGRFQGWTAMSENEGAAFLAEMAELPLFVAGEWIQLGIAEPETNQLLGDIGVFLAADQRSAEIGFTLAPHAQGRGIATAAIREALQLLFETTDVAQVFCITDRRNTSSIRVLERVGFLHHESRHTVFKGELCCEDVYIFQRDCNGFKSS
jgi:RimJ/RimL family protein N-acetyltransferase